MHTLATAKFPRMIARRVLSRVSAILIGLIVLFLLSPLVIVVITSFDGSPYVEFPPPSWSWRWYAVTFETSTFLTSLGTSILLAAFASLISLFLAVPGAILAVRRPSYLTRIMRALAITPLLLPEVMLGLALLVLFVAVVHIRLTFATLLLAHVTITLPFTTQILFAAFSKADPDLEAAARVLGASPISAVVLVLLPSVRTSFVTAFLLAFLFSFDNTAMSLLVAPPGVTTLPLLMYGLTLNQSNPGLAAMSTVLIAAMTVVVLMVTRRGGSRGLLELAR